MLKHHTDLTFVVQQVRPPLDATFIFFEYFMTFKIASLFSGCGGLDLGFSGGFTFYNKRFKKLNTKIVFANDFDKDAATCYNTNPLLVKDGTKCLLEDIRNINADTIPDFDILLAGFPCQPFSNAGNRKGINDKNGRGTLFEECERILKNKVEKGHRPKAFVFENVRGIMSCHMDDGTPVTEEIQKRMEKLGYNVSCKLICASNYGVPQQRYRFLIIGVDNVFEQFDFRLLDKIVENNKIPSVSHGTHEALLLGSILQGLQELPDNDCWEYSLTTQKTVELIGPCSHGNSLDSLFHSKFSISNLPKVAFEGKSWKDIPYELLSPRFKRIYDDPKRYHSPKFFRRFAYGEINGTITASAQPENCGITHPIENRRYTVREIARIQSFPDNFLFTSIPLQSRYKVIGNAVPPILGWVVASALITHITK